MKLPFNEYPKLEFLVLTNCNPMARRFKLEDELVKFTKNELESLEMFIWGHALFGSGLKDIPTAYEIFTVVKEFLGEPFGEGYMVRVE